MKSRTERGTAAAEI